MSFINKVKEHFSNKQIAKIEKILENIIQIKEINGEIWLTYCDNPICPCSMFKDAPIEVIKAIRERKKELYNKQSNEVHR